MTFFTQIGGSLMSSQFRLCVFFIFSLVVSSMVWGNNPLVKIGFNGDTDEENKVIVIGAGFGSYPEATVSYGDIPTDNGFEGATDGRGMIMHAEPGEGVMVFTQNISTPNCALIRASIRASAPHMTLYLASVDQGESTYVSTLTPNNPASFVGKYNRIANFFVPPSTGLQALLQIINTSETEELTVYIDNFEVLEMGDDLINLSIEDLVVLENHPEPTVTPISTNTPEPTATATPTPIEERETITIPLSGLLYGAKPLEMVYIEPGTFIMGSPNDEQDRWEREGPQHQVALTNGFYMSKYEITQAQWEAVMGSNPSRDYGVGPNNPVYHVSWNDCQAFIEKLNQMGQGTFRLPTEAEWEYSCRAGTTTRYYFGDSDVENMAKQYCWYEKNANDEYWTTPHAEKEGTQPVGQKIPNSFGLYDMSGNVWEWCQDWFGSYSSSVQTDPKGPPSGSDRILRGGDWNSPAHACRSAVRGFFSPVIRYGGLGLRLVLFQTDVLIPTATPTPIEETITIPLSNLPSGAKPLEMVYIEPSTFIMGSPSDEKDRWVNEGPQHQVTLTKGFYMGKYEVTQAQWQAVMGNNPSWFDGKPNNPVESVSWNDCQIFINMLNQMGQGTFSFRLPTEAEWEFACRAGTTTRYYWGDDTNDSQIKFYAWYSGNNSLLGTKPVGQKIPNTFGLYDMSGNVWEWCQDRYGSYESASQINPTGSNSGSNRVVRGGGWADSADCRSARRNYDRPDFWLNGIGFRLVLSRTP
jgi:formylglycine-generating enzyme required for sulfatase activity